jgi:hypothetical protein
VAARVRVSSACSSESSARLPGVGLSRLAREKIAERATARAFGGLQRLHGTGLLHQRARQLVEQILADIQVTDLAGIRPHAATHAVYDIHARAQVLQGGGWIAAGTRGASEYEPRLPLDLGILVGTAEVQRAAGEFFGHGPLRVAQLDPRERHEQRAFIAAVTGALDGERRVETLACRGVVTGHECDRAETLQRADLGLTDAELPRELELAFVRRGRARSIFALPPERAERAEDVHLAAPIAERANHAERFLRQLERAIVVAELRRHDGQLVKRVGLAVPVSDAAVDLDGPQEERARLLVFAEPLVTDRHLAVHEAVVLLVLVLHRERAPIALQRGTVLAREVEQRAFEHPGTHLVAGVSNRGEPGARVRVELQGLGISALVLPDLRHVPDRARLETRVTRRPCGFDGPLVAGPGFGVAGPTEQRHALLAQGFGEQRAVLRGREFGNEWLQLVERGVEFAGAHLLDDRIEPRAVRGLRGSSYGRAQNERRQQRETGCGGCPTCGSG